MEDKELLAIITQFEKFQESKYKLELEQNRLINYHIVAVHNSKIRRPNQLYKFNWESDKPLMDKKELKRLISIYGYPSAN